MSSFNICLSYNATATLMEKIEDSFDRDLLQWKDEVERGVKMEKDVSESLQKAEAANNSDLIEECRSTLDAHREIMHPGYSFTGDNVDIDCSTRQMTLTNRNKDHICFSWWPLRTARIPSNHLPSNVANADIKKIPFSSFISSPEEQATLKEELAVHVGLKWAHYIPALSWLKVHLPPSITHENMDKTRMKSDKVRLYRNKLF